MQPNTLDIAIESPAGGTDAPRDLYLVFLNEDAPSGNLMVVVGTQFRLAGQTLSR